MGAKRMKIAVQVVIRRKYILYLLLFLLTAFTGLPPASAGNIMHFPDANLEQAVRDELERPTGVITRTDMRRLVSLEAGRREITDLSGLEQASRLQELNLHQNRIRDISVLENLTRLQELYLGDNRVNDISALERMGRLERLHLGNNPLSDIEPLQNLRRLRELRLEGAPLNDLSPLGNLNNLEVLYLDRISADFSILQELPRLQELSLAGSQLQDLTFLEDLSTLIRLDLQDNNLQEIPALDSLTELTWLSLENNRVADLSFLEGLPRLITLNLRGNELEEIAPLRQLENIAWIDLRDNYLHLAADLPPSEVIAALEQQGTEVFSEPQKLPFFRGSGLVQAEPASGGSLLRTPAADRFTIMNPGLGWRIRSVTFAHQEGKPLDFIAEIGRREARAQGSRFSWQLLPARERLSVQEKLPHTVTFTAAADISLGMGVQLWPGYAADEARTFYFSEVLLENIYTGDTYLVELAPDSTGNYRGPGDIPVEDRAVAATQDLANLTEVQETLALALQAREPDLSVRLRLPQGMILETVLEDIFEVIYRRDDYLRYSMQRKTYEWTTRAGVTTIDFRFGYHATREEEEVVERQVQEILEEITTPQMDDHLLTRAIHDYVVANVEYDQGRREHSAYAALVKGRAVCQGYALLIHKMLQEAGIESRIISGQAGGENHAWNMVRLDDSWYHLDATWNDPIPDVPGRVLYDYYNRTDAQMRATHTWDEEAYPPANRPYEMPW